jgi:hypothetical protein
LACSISFGQTSGAEGRCSTRGVSDTGFFVIRFHTEQLRLLHKNNVVTSKTKQHRDILGIFTTPHDILAIGLFSPLPHFSLSLSRHLNVISQINSMLGLEPL